MFSHALAEERVQNFRHSSVELSHRMAPGTWPKTWQSTPRITGKSDVKAEQKKIRQIPTSKTPKPRNSKLLGCHENWNQNISRAKHLGGIRNELPGN